MSGWRRIVRVPRPIKRQAREDVEAEIAFHLDARTQELIAGGLTLADAQFRAEQESGDPGAARNDLEPGVRRRERRTRIAGTLGEIFGDLRYGLRGLRRSPAFATVAILTLALAIAANTSIFSVVNAVLLRPLPFGSPEQLTMLWTGTPGQDVQGRPDYLTAESWRRESNSFADMAILDPVTVTLTDTEGAERISVARISANFFPLLGVQPLRGRSFSSEEADQRQRLALISYDFWQTRFGGSNDVLGESIRLDGKSSQIIGILPAGFQIPSLNGDVWEPHTLFPDWEATGNEGTWFVVGRLRPNVTVDQAQAEMTAISTVLDGELPAADRNRGVSVVPLNLYVVGPALRLALWVLAGAALCVLLIAAANVVSLSLARSVGRAREFAVRATLGASPGRIVRQMLAESVTLAVVSGLLGTFLALAAIQMIRAFGPSDLARLDEAGLDLSVLSWALGVSLLTGILIGLAPALTTVRRNLRLSAAEGGRGGSQGVAARGVRRGLVVAEFALAIILLTGSGLLVRSWLSLTAVDPGFAPQRVLSMNISTTAFASDAQRVNFYSDVLDQVGSLPGVVGAGMIGDLFADRAVERTLTAEGGAAASERMSLRIDEVSNALFTTLQTPLLKGRFFSVEDGADSPPVAIINEEMAERLFRGRDPVGRRFKPGAQDSDASWITIVGLVGDMRRQGLEIEPNPQIFVPLAQQPSGSETLLVRTLADDPLEMAAAVLAAVRRVDEQVPVYFVSAVEGQIGSDLTQRRFQTLLLMGFSVIALVMAAIGIYGLIHYSVAARTREFAIRMAVGARAGDIFRTTIGEGMRLSAIGLILGIAGALLVSRAGSSLLFGVTPADPLTFTMVSLLLIAVAAAACYFPARRSMTVDPIEALRPD